LPEGAKTEGDRVFIPKSARDGVGLPVRPIASMLAFAGAVLGSAKDWQDNLLACMPGQRERIARVMLSPGEGGLNLTMPAERSMKLMTYGLNVGEQFASGALDFQEHCWRRALVTYAQLEHATHDTDRVWNKDGFGNRFRAYAPYAVSYGAVTMTDRADIADRLEAFAGLSMKFTPRVAGASRKMPRPAGRLSIRPDI
jgi:hypothetical protein